MKLQSLKVCPERSHGNWIFQQRGFTPSLSMSICIADSELLKGMQKRFISYLDWHIIDRRIRSKGIVDGAAILSLSVNLCHAF